MVSSFAVQWRFSYHTVSILHLDVTADMSLCQMLPSARSLPKRLAKCLLLCFVVVEEIYTPLSRIHWSYSLVFLLTVGQIGLLLEHSRVSVDLLNDSLDAQLLAIELHLLAILCR